MDSLFERSQEIVNQAIAEYQPYAIVLMFSGGDDSLTAYHVARAIGIPLSHFLHGVTGTGIPQTTEFARRVGEQSGLHYIEANAGNAYEKYVWRKGFFGRGNEAHTMAYHVLKNEHFEKVLSRYIRKGQRGRNILLVNGARWQESSNRERMKNEPIRQGRRNGPNIWVNVINDWTKHDCAQFLRDYERNPVTELLCRSVVSLGTRHNDRVGGRTMSEYEMIWTGQGYQITLLTDGRFQLEFFDGQPVIVDRAEFRGILRTMQSAEQYASMMFDHPAQRLGQLPPD